MKYSYGKKELYDRDKNTRVFIFSIPVCIIIMMILPSLSSTVYGNDGQPSSDFSNGKNVSDNDDRFVALTLDDGFESQYTNAITILDKYGFKASFSIICEYVGE
jgi:Polysaccharide deacetylase